MDHVCIDLNPTVIDIIYYIGDFIFRLLYCLQTKYDESTTKNGDQAPPHVSFFNFSGPSRHPGSRLLKKMFTVLPPDNHY